MFCYKCGQKLPETSRFCPRCGATVPEPGAAPAEKATKPAPVQKEVKAMKQLDPKAVWLFFMGSISGCLVRILFIGVFAIPLFFVLRRSEGESPVARFAGVAMGILVILIFTYLIIAYLRARLSYHFYRYELTDDGFRKEYGIVGKKYVTIPYDRIQNVNIYRGALERILGLSDLHIQTAGTAGVIVGRRGLSPDPEGRLPGLAPEVAEQVRDELVRRAKRSKNQGL